MLPAAALPVGVLPVDGAAIAALIPHQGAMCLLDAVLACDANSIVCLARSHGDPAHPLRENDRLAALHLIEYSAQAMALHGALLARAAGERAQPGLLVLVREVDFTVDCIDDIAAALEVSAHCLLAGADGWLYEFTVIAAGQRLAGGRVAVVSRS